MPPSSTTAAAANRTHTTRVLEFFTVSALSSRITRMLACRSARATRTSSKGLMVCWVRKSCAALGPWLRTSAMAGSAMARRHSSARSVTTASWLLTAAVAAGFAAIAAVRASWLAMPLVYGSRSAALPRSAYPRMPVSWSSRAWVRSLAPVRMGPTWSSRASNALRVVRAAVAAPVASSRMIATSSPSSAATRVRSDQSLPRSRRVRLVVMPVTGHRRGW